VTAVELYLLARYPARVTLRPSTLERVGGYWARSLGCERDALAGTGPAIVPGRTGRDEVRLLARDDATVIVASPERLPEVRRAVEAAGGRDAPELVAAFDPPPGRVRGPQFVGYADRSTLRTAPDDGIRVLTREDADALARLRAACGRREWSARVGGFSFDAHTTLLGRFVGGRLVAVAAHGEDDPVAGIGVVVRPDHRRGGHGTAVVVASASDALENGLVPEYRAHESWTASVGLARAAGFRRYGTYAAFDLDRTDHGPGIGLRSTG
jgi:GNAT superfamily N-acetyltransferase